MRFTAKWVTGLVLVSAGTACTAILGIEPGIPDDAAAPDAANGADVNANGDAPADTAPGLDSGSGLDATVDAAPLDDAASNSDAPDVIAAGDTQTGDAMPFDACPAPTVDQVNGLFVSKAGADGSTCGFSTAAPCLTIATALSRAAATAGRTHIYVGEGEYDENLVLPPGITIEGGWHVTAGSWTSACGGDLAGIVKIVNPGGDPATVRAESIGGTTQLTNLTVYGKDAKAMQPGESAFGIFATGSNTVLVLNDVVVSVAHAGNGVAGGKGPDGVVPSGTCAADNGAGGAPASGSGGGGPLGNISAKGFTPFSGDPGPTGSPGHNGTAGGTGATTTYTGCAYGRIIITPGPTATVVTQSLAAPPLHTQAAPIGTITPIGLTCTGNLTATCAANSGLSGCGGGAGAGGLGGGGGGVSVALFVVSAQVTVNGGSFIAGGGGDGAPGGAGGAGAGGSAGVQGSENDCYNAACTSGSCVRTTGFVVSSGGAAGGTGGPGGAGGTGGGGSGGSTFGVYNGAGVVSLNGSPVLAAGPAGKGQGGGVDGVTKASGP